jgi:putative phosphoesterase
MKTLILSDIHGNLPALEAVLKHVGEYGICLFLGDVVDYGPFPNECIQFLMQQMDVGVMGNHDNAIAYGEDCRCRGDFRTFSVETRAWHKQLIGNAEMQFLRSLRPLEQISIDGQSVVIAHATPEGDLFRYVQEDEVDSVVDGMTAQIVLLGHTHHQFMKRVGNTLVVNPGSVGLARDGGQACYALLREGEITEHRLEYDVERTIEALWKAPISEESKKGLTIVLRGERLAQNQSRAQQ